MTVKTSLLNWDNIAKSKELESVNFSEILTSLEAVISQSHNSELDWIWASSCFQVMNSEALLRLSKHQKKDHG